MIAMNGHIVAQGSQFSLNDVEVVTATIDIEDVRAHRTSRSRGFQVATSEKYHRIEVPFALSVGKFGETDGERTLCLEVTLHEAKFHRPEEEIASVPSYYFEHTAMNILLTDLDLRAGSGIISDDPGPRDILYLSAVVLTAVPQRSLCSLCVAWSPKPPLERVSVSS